MFVCLVACPGLRLLSQRGLVLTVALFACLDTAFAQSQRTLLRAVPDRVALVRPVDPRVEPQTKRILLLQQRGFATPSGPVFDAAFANEMRAFETKGAGRANGIERESGGRRSGDLVRAAAMPALVDRYQARVREPRGCRLPALGDRGQPVQEQRIRSAAVPFQRTEALAFEFEPAFAGRPHSSKAYVCVASRSRLQPPVSWVSRR